MTVMPDVRDIGHMDRPALLALWQDLFGRPAPRRLSQPFLRRFLAFESQSRRFGGLPREVRAALEKEPDVARRPESPALKPGARLLREWNGVTHVVDVTDGGYVWKGQAYRSLSAIARAITGAHWSGPRFFGLGGKSAR
ncbi:DUF2924 domain-containing protein [Marimonas lutisalis]|uniref:DUF2924 domain-containing protein n=1 Tax=Marimonas lutisalis TaxID=2545756 RepID=UPI001F203931|nr:DUF2924 domain-containing protein [Marimonas lutisalis]